MSEQINLGEESVRKVMSSSLDFVRAIFSPASVKTRSICSSSSVLSVNNTILECGIFSKIHFARITIKILFPDPCVCQIIPPSWFFANFCASFNAKYWCGLGNFFTPPSKTIPLYIISKNRFLLHSFFKYLSSL